jgi:hypothetical protein
MTLIEPSEETKRKWPGQAAVAWKDERGQTVDDEFVYNTGQKGHEGKYDLSVSA